MKRIAAAVLFVAALTATAQRQPEIPTLGETIEVSVVNVEVFVTDKQGRRVGGLTKDDFEIREDGKPRPISNFSEYAPDAASDDGSVSIDVAAEPPAARRARRMIVLFIEQQHLWPEHRDDFFGSLQSLLDSSMEDGDEAMVVSWNLKSAVRQPMTGDRKAIRAAIAQLAKESQWLRIDPARQTREALAADAAFERSMAGSRFTPIGPGNDDIACALIELDRIRAKTLAITSVLNTLAGVEDARKVLIMGTRRYGAVAGIDCFAGQLTTDQRQRLRTEQLREQIIAAANANGVTVYPIHPEDPRPDIATASTREIGEGAPQLVLEHAIMLNEMEAARDIATRTGGLAEWGPDIVKLLPRIEDDLERYYSLGYRATGTPADRTRNISVSVKRPGLTVRTRKQFVEKSPATQMKDRVLANLAYPVEGSRISVDVEVGDIRRDSRKRFSVPVKVRVPIAALTTVPTGKDATGAFSVYIAAGGAAAASDITQKTQTFSIPLGDIARAKQSHFTYEAEIAVDEKTDNVSIGVVDEVGRDFGLVRVDVKGRRTPSS